MPICEMFGNAENVRTLPCQHKNVTLSGRNEQIPTVYFKWKMSCQYMRLVQNLSFFLYKNTPKSSKDQMDILNKYINISDLQLTKFSWLMYKFIGKKR